MKAKPFISIVIPVYNEAKNITLLTEELVSILPKLKKTWEIIFIDDGSTDESLQALEAVSNKWAGIRVFGFEKNSGQTAAFAAGFSRARGEVIITMDGDMQNDPRDIPKLLEKIGEYDLVCGWRKKRNDNLIRRVSSRIANSVRNILSGENIRDVGCSLKAFRSEYVQKIKLYNGMHRFFPTLVKMEGGRVLEVAVNHRPRKHGKAKYTIGNRAFRSFLDLLAVCWMKNRSIKYNLKEYAK